MNKIKRISITVLTILIVTLLMTAGVSAAETTTSATTSAIANYTLYFDCSDGKLYKDEAMTKPYTDQSGKWGAYYINDTYYALILNGFSFTTSEPNALVIPEDSGIILADNTTNTLTSTYKGSEISSAIWGMDRLSIQSAGTGNSSLIAQGGTNTGGEYSDGIYVENIFTITSGHIFAYGGQDRHSSGIDTGDITIYSGELVAKGNERSIGFYNSYQWGYLRFSAGALFFGGKSAETVTPFSLYPGGIDKNTFAKYPYLHVYFTLSDIPSNSWYYQNVSDLYKAGTIKGYANSDGVSFQIRPQTPITRAEFVTILARIFSDEEGLDQYADKYTFTDVPDWASKYVGWAANSGYVEGYNDTHFGSGDNITRQDIVTILYRIVTQKGLTLDYYKYQINFVDENQIADYAKEAVTMMQKSYVINGYDNGYVNGNSTYRFEPRSAATRAETITMIHSFMKVYKLGATW